MSEDDEASLSIPHILVEMLDELLLLLIIVLSTQSQKVLEGCLTQCEVARPQWCEIVDVAIPRQEVRCECVPVAVLRPKAE